jgi:hypothetical protein
MLTGWVEHSDRPHREISRSNFERNNTDTKILLFLTTWVQIQQRYPNQTAIHNLLHILPLVYKLNGENLALRNTAVHTLA